MYININIIRNSMISLFLIVIFTGCSTQRKTTEYSSLTHINEFESDLDPASTQSIGEKGKVLTERHHTKLIDYKNPYEVRIPVLMFHSIDVNGKNNLVISPLEFKKEMDWLEKNDYTTASMEDVYLMLTTGKSVPERPIALTFDDGYENNYTYAYPILKEKNFKATIFLITDNIGLNGFLKADQIMEMYKNNIDFQGHTAKHMELNLLSYDKQLNEMKKSKGVIEGLINNRTNVLCYPVGKYNQTTITAAKDAGYKMCFTTKYGFSKCSDGLYTLTRVRMFPGMNLESIKRN